MRVTFLMDHCGPGGAQRQCCLVARLLLERGLDVDLLTYADEPFLVDGAAVAIPRVRLASRRTLGRCLAVRHRLRRSRPDVVVAFLRTPSLLAEFAWFPGRPFAVVAAERNHYPAEPRWWRWLRLRCHGLADAVVAVSDEVRTELVASAPWLADRCTTIPNAVDLTAFAAAGSPQPHDGLRLAVLAKYDVQKAPDVLLDALAAFVADHPDLPVDLRWHGPTVGDGAVLAHTRARVRRLGLDGAVTLAGPTNDVGTVLAWADALVLPSYHEGQANVVAEAMACARPVVATDTGATGRLVDDGVTGFLCTPGDVADLRRAIARLAALSPAERTAMGAAARRRAEELLAPSRSIAAWVDLLARVTDPPRSAPRSR